MKNLLTILAFVAVTTAANAQYKTNLFQTQSIPTMEYTSLAGWHGGLQVNSAYQNTFPGIPITNVDYTLSVDYYSPKLKGAYGINAFHSRLGTGRWTINNIDLYYTQRLSVGAFTISPSASLSLRQFSVDWNQVVFPDPNDEEVLWQLFSDTPPISSSLNKMILHVGSSLAFKSIYGAFQLSNVNQPDYSFFEESESRLPMRYSGIIGWSKNLNEWNLNPTIEFNSIGSFNYLSMAFNASWKNINAGVKYRWADQLGFAAGYDIAGKVRLSYAYAITTSSLGTQSLGSHFMSLRWWFLKEQRADQRMLPNLGML